MSNETFDLDRLEERILRFGDPTGEHEALEAEALYELLAKGLVLYGCSNDVDLVPGLKVLYAQAVARLSEPERFDLYRRIETLAERDDVSLNAFMPFLVVDPSQRIVSTATIDYAMIGWPGSDDPLGGVRDLIDLLRERSTRNSGALLGGLICLGDRRVNALLDPLLETFTSAEVEVASKAVTGSTRLAAIEFWLGWLEKLPGDPEDLIFSNAAAALFRLVDDAVVPFVGDGERNFGYLRRGEVEPYVDREAHSFEEVAQALEGRFRAIAAREPEPKLLPMVMARYGIFPVAVPDWLVRET